MDWRAWNQTKTYSGVMQLLTIPKYMNFRSQLLQKFELKTEIKIKHKTSVLGQTQSGYT